MTDFTGLTSCSSTARHSKKQDTVATMQNWGKFSLLYTYLGKRSGTRERGGVDMTDFTGLTSCSIRVRLVIAKTLYSGHSAKLGQVFPVRHPGDERGANSPNILDLLLLKISTS
jgi:hypothetical protein